MNVLFSDLRFLLLAASCIAFAACTSESTKIEKHEDLLAASGFTVRPADSQKRQAMLERLPAHHFVQRSRNGNAIFLYADPLVCDCLYVGDDKAYSKYQNAIVQRQMARDAKDDQSQLVRESRDDYNYDIKAAEIEDSTWDWGQWGPGWW